MIKTTKEAGVDAYVERLKQIAGRTPMRYKVITFGCQQNEADSEKISALLSSAGFLPSLTDGDEDVVIVNTCAIRKHAEEKALSLLGAYKHYRTAKPHFTLGVVGCMGAKPDTVNKLKQKFHYVTFTAPPSSIHRIPEYIYTSLTEATRLFDTDYDCTDIVEGIAPDRKSGYKAWVSIMYGCNNFCTYCIVPYVRGRERSRCSSDVIEECRELVSNGAREITLLGQNVNSYSSDINFAELISRIAKIEGDFIIRFMTSHPKDTSDELIAAIRDSRGKITPYFHLPLQSGSDSILKRMNRTYSAAKYLSVAQKLRTEIPGIALSTDIIIGFPGETDEDFERTLEVMRTVRFDMVYAFLYSPREGTAAAKLSDRVQKSVMDKRMTELISLAEDISLELNLPYRDTTVRVLTDSVETKDGAFVCTGRTGTNKLVRFTSDREITVGEFIYVHIDEPRLYDLIGTAVG